MILRDPSVYHINTVPVLGNITDGPITLKICDTKECCPELLVVWCPNAGSLYILVRLWNNSPVIEYRQCT